MAPKIYRDLSALERLEVLKNELDKRAIKLNYMKLDIGVIMQKNILKNL